MSKSKTELPRPGSKDNKALQLLDIISRGSLQEFGQFMIAKPSDDFYKITLRSKETSLWQITRMISTHGITDADRALVLFHFMLMAIWHDNHHMFQYLLSLLTTLDDNAIPKQIFTDLLNHACNRTLQNKPIIHYLFLRLASIKPQIITYKKNEYHLYDLLGHASYNKSSFRALSLVNLRYDSDQYKAFCELNHGEGMFRQHKILILLGYQAVCDGLGLGQKVSGMFSQHGALSKVRYTQERLSEYSTESLYQMVSKLTETNQTSAVSQGMKAAMLAHAFVEGRINEDMLLTIVYVLKQKLRPNYNIDTDLVLRQPEPEPLYDGKLFHLHSWINNRMNYKVIREDLFDTPRLELLNRKFITLSSSSKLSYYDLFDRFSGWSSLGEFLPVLCEIQGNTIEICLDYSHDFSVSQAVWNIKEALKPFMALWCGEDSTLQPSTDLSEEQDDLNRYRFK